ncbi:hypothetical protein HD554DRAFT_2144186 [Boletus coccyginus]|nr:hypothetical protein HD554DRAFT_2144186 [Boletus coccyginus]
MDQDAFRQLLSSSRQSQFNAKQAVLTTANSIPQKATTPTSSELAFKPRKVKKIESRYRDRAAERREGTGNDYAQVEAVLEDFEKRVANEDRDVIEQQRKYLGGDSQHTILVKGLDMSLLEQHRARAAASTDDDEILEQAFTEVTSISEPTETKKRTREDIIRNLRAKQQNGDMLAEQLAVEKSEEDGSTFEVAKKAGKFRPIGFKPIGQTEEKSKKRKVKERKESVKKRQKVESGPVQSRTNTSNKPAEETPAVSQERSTTEPSSSKTPEKPPEPEPTLLDEDFDIFAGAGDYEGFPSDGESEEEHHDHDMEETRAASTTQEVFPVSAVGTKGWFDEPEPEVQHAPTPPEKSPVVPETKVTEEEPQEMRLKPLESSALPSIRDFLAMEEAAQKAEKRKTRKEKKKKKKVSGDDDDD